MSGKYFGKQHFAGEECSNISWLMRLKQWTLQWYYEREFGMAKIVIKKIPWFAQRAICLRVYSRLSSPAEISSACREPLPAWTFGVSKADGWTCGIAISKAITHLWIMESLLLETKPVKIEAETGGAAVKEAHIDGEIERSFPCTQREKDIDADLSFRSSPCYWIIDFQSAGFQKCKKPDWLQSNSFISKYQKVVEAPLGEKLWLTISRDEPTGSVNCGFHPYGSPLEERGRQWPDIGICLHDEDNR